MISRHTHWLALALHRYFSKLVSDYGFDGASTMNELRVHASILLATLRNTPISVGEIADETNIPRSTVSRVVANLIERHRITEVAGQDARQTLLIIPEQLHDRVTQWGDDSVEILRQAAKDTYSNDLRSANALTKVISSLLP